MPTETEMREALRRAQTTIRDSWRDIASTYTLGWGGPIEAIEERFPNVRNAVADIREQISNNLPVVIFQTRQHPEADTVFVVPFWKDTGNPYNSRVVQIRVLTAREQQLLGMFAQAFWFLIDMKALPDPQSGDALQTAMRRWTGREFFE